MSLKYPRWLPRASPTPPEGMACEKCQVVEWVTPQMGRVFYHACRSRLRPLTPQEAADFKAHVRTLDYY